MKAVRRARWLLLIGGLGLLGDDPGRTWIVYGLLALGGIMLILSFRVIGLRAFPVRLPF